MSKPYRRQYDKYKKCSYTAAMLVKIHCPYIYTILEWLEPKLKPSEYISISNWNKDWFYIEVLDDDITESIVNTRMAFTVNMRKDRIMFCNDYLDNPVGGGNCLVRANKWKRYLKKRFDKQYTPEHFNIYKDPRPLPLKIKA